MEALFDFERLKVFELAAEFVTWTEDQMPRLLPRRAHLADHLHRAGTSIALNVAEGAGEYSPAEKARFYRIARRSATECAAIVILLDRMGSVAPAPFARARDLLNQIVAILTTMCRRAEVRKSGSAP